MSVKKLWPQFKAVRSYPPLKEVTMSDSKIYIQGLSAKDCEDQPN